MNNYYKKIFYNFCVEFEGLTPQELQNEDLTQYTIVLDWFLTPKTLGGLNNNLKHIIKELYLIDIKNPIEYLYY